MAQVFSFPARPPVVRDATPDDPLHRVMMLSAERESLTLESARITSDMLFLWSKVGQEISAMGTRQREILERIVSLDDQIGNLTLAVQDDPKISL